MRVISVIIPFLFEIPPEHIIWEIVCAYVTLEMSTMLSEHVAKLHISIIHLPVLSPNRLCTYHPKKRVQVCGNNTSMAQLKIAVTPLLTHWSYHILALTRRHVRGNVRIYKTGHCHAQCNVPALWPPSYFENFSHDKLVICFSSCNLPFCVLIGNISVTFVENGLLITPIYFVIEAQIHTNSYTLQRCQMTVMSSGITGQQTVCSTLSSDKHTET